MVHEEHPLVIDENVDNSLPDNGDFDDAPVQINQEPVLSNVQLINDPVLANAELIQNIVDNQNDADNQNPVENEINVANNNDVENPNDVVEQNHHDENPNTVHPNNVIINLMNDITSKIEASVKPREPIIHKIVNLRSRGVSSNESASMVNLDASEASTSGVSFASNENLAQNPQPVPVPVQPQVIFLIFSLL